jgi:hypothetical protein
VASFSNKTVEYKGTYQDKFGTEEINIINDFKSISFKLGDFNFISRHFDDFFLDGYGTFTPEQLKRFIFKPIDIYQSDEKVYELKNFILSFTIPVTTFNLKTKQATNSNLSIKLDIKSVDNETQIFLKIVYNDREFSGTSSLFEIAADQINKQIDGEFIIKNCFWCLYSDYSVYGQGLAGSMLCFLKYKDKYLKVKDKDEYMELPNDIPSVQEIYYCDSFEPRKPGTGYRG